MNSSSDICRGCMNEVSNNGVSLSITKIAELYQNCTGIEINKMDLITISLCDNCYLKCNQWKTFKAQCEISEQALRELSIQQIKSTINEIEFLDLGLDIKEEEAYHEHEFDNEFGPEFDNQLSSSDEDDRPLSARVGVSISSTLCQVKMEEGNNDPPIKKETVMLDKLLDPIKMLVTKGNSNESFFISSNPYGEKVIRGTQKYVLSENTSVESVVEWNKADTEYKYNEGTTKELTVYKCKSCLQVFRGLNIYELHFMNFHMNKEPITCRICGSHFSRKSFLKQHLIRTHVVSTKTASFMCEECDVGFEKAKQLKQHNRTHVIYKCEECESIFSTHSRLTKHSRIHQRFYCDQCNKSFNRKYTLAIHVKTHIEDRPHVCTTCGFAFKTRVNLIAHIKIHNNERNFICPTCGKMFIRSHALKKHMFSHTDERPFKCPHCPKSSKSSQQFKKHLETHNANAVKPHVCEFCNRSFKIKKVYVHHRMTHTGERPHECNLCDRKFIQIIALKKHMKTHEAI